MGLVCCCVDACRLCRWFWFSRLFMVLCVYMSCEVHMAPFLRHDGKMTLLSAAARAPCCHSSKGFCS